MLSDAERNLRFWPVELEQPGLVLGFPFEGANPPAGSAVPLGPAAMTRAYALVGPQATLTGLAERVLELFLRPLVAALPADDDRKDLPDPSSLARALAQLAKTTVSAQERFVLEWRTGTLFPLPIQRSTTGWVVFLDEIKTSAVGNLLLPDPTTVPAADLLGPTAIAPVVVEDRPTLPEAPTVLTAQVTALVQGRTPQQVATLLAHDLLDNPYANCLRVVEALLQLEARSVADGKALAATLAAALLPPQLATLAWTTGGNAVLRRAWARLTPADPMYEPASQALALVVKTAAQGNKPRDYHTPQQRRPGAAGVAAVEPPLTKGQSTVKGQVVAAMGLGRRTTYGWTDAFWAGPFTAGVIPVRPLDTAHGASVPWPTWASPEMITQRRHVVARIAPIEGEIDAVRLADAGLVSIGCQQWSFHVDTEGTVLLEHFRKRSPDHFDVFFGLYDLGLAVCDATGKISVDEAAVPAAAGGTVAASNVRAANPHAFTGAAPNAARDYYPTYVTLLQSRGNADPIVLDAKNEQGTARFLFFGYAPLGKSKGIGSPTWAARSTIALQSSQPLQECELAVASFRFTRILDDEAVWATDWTTGTPFIQKNKVVKPDVRGLGGAPRAAPTGLRVTTTCPADHTLTELFGSQYAAALALDAHINAPGAQKAAIMRSWQRTVDAFLAEAQAQLSAETGQSPPPEDVLALARTLIHVGASEALSDPFLSRFAVSYNTLRGYFENAKKNSVFPDRSFSMGFEHDLSLSPRSGTFVGWT